MFIDTERDSWNMDPGALEKAFEIYPDVKLVVCAELYGFSGDIVRIRDICHAHGALLIEDAAEAMGATWQGKQCGSFGDYAAMCAQVRSDNKALFTPEHGKSCPTEILSVLASINAEGRPIWKPMHMQPIMRLHRLTGGDIDNIILRRAMVD